MLVTELCDSNLDEYLAKVKLEAFKEREHHHVPPPAW